MMYDSKFVVAIKAGGKILKETKDLVKLPFGSEFSVLVKNLNSRRAKFTLHIDGTDVLDGESIIVNANSDVEMKRFIRNGNMDSGNAFKFIERTAAIEDGPRGIKMDDGVVRVEFWFEKQPDQHVTTYHTDVYKTDYYPFYSRPYYGSFTSTAGLSGFRGITSNSVKMKSNSGLTDKDSYAVAQNAMASYSATCTDSATTTFTSTDSIENTLLKSEATTEVGITVPGSKVDQKFHTVYGFNAESISNVIILRLAGKIGEAPIQKPVLARTKQKCETCGHTNKAHAKFCSECGTSLELV
jgi:hypothetical protein